MNDVCELVQRYQRQGILVDTNILLLYFVGAANPQRIRRFSRTERFSLEDYDLLLNAFRYFQRIVTTPNILTEVYNLLNQIGEPDRRRCLIEVAKLVRQFEKFDEIYVSSKEVTALEGFLRFGLTDCGIEHLAKDQFLVLTDDLRLADYLGRAGIDVLNFNTIRVYSWS